MRNMYVNLLLIGFFLAADASQCVQNPCHALTKTKTNVHLVPHSHDDVGWLKTVDQYYYGVSAGVSVDSIITSVLQALTLNKHRRFTQVETAFFKKWWEIQPESVKSTYKLLVEEGHIEIANGGWVMNDEACANYQSIIHQYTRGLKFINDSLGPCGAPKVGWQIDPFGHSKGQAFLFKQLGFDGAFISRIDYRERLQRMNYRTSDFLWESSSSVENPNIFYNFMFNHYGSPTGFCFDFMCSDDAINNDPDSFDYNGDVKLNQFEAILDELSNYATTNNILIPMGGDFNYVSAFQHFINMDRLIELFENHDVYNVFYSTPSCYIRAVNQTLANLTTKTGDFFPYATAESEYWTGFYSSRPNAKRLERKAYNILQANKQLRAIFKLSSGYSGDIDTDSELKSLQDSVATVQHHDAITGTEKQSVAEYYNREILKGIGTAEESIGDVIKSLLSKSEDEGQLKMSSCLLSNISVCENTDQDSFLVAVYNPLSKAVSTVVQLPVANEDFTITGPQGSVQYDVSKSISNFTYVNDTEPSAYQLNFLAEEVPPMGINMYNVKVTEITSGFSKGVGGLGAKETLKFGTESVNFELDSYTNKLKSVTMNNITMEITQDFYYYKSETGQDDIVASGAYLFRPMEGTEAVKVSNKIWTLEYSLKGNLVEEAHVRVNDWLMQIIRVYKQKGENFIEFDWLVGPIEVNETDLVGKELVTRFKATDFKNEGVFYTDSNGREMIMRKLNERDDFNFDPTVEPVTSNYYPVTSRILMRDLDKKLEVAVVNDRSQGATSLKNGQIELMIHRRILVDDFKGVAEALDEQEYGQGMVVRGRHFLILGSTTSHTNYSMARLGRDLQLKKLLEPYVLVQSKSDDVANLEDSLNLQYKFLSDSLPENVNILSFERWDDDQDTFLLRLEHLFEEGEDEELSESVTVDFNELFLDFNVGDVKETTLGGNVWKADSKDTFYWDSPVKDRNDTDFNIILQPMEIRTFVITLKQKSK